MTGEVVFSWWLMELFPLWNAIQESWMKESTKRHSVLWRNPSFLRGFQVTHSEVKQCRTQVWGREFWKLKILLTGFAWCAALFSSILQGISFIQHLCCPAACLCLSVWACECVCFSVPERETKPPLRHRREMLHEYSHSCNIYFWIKWKR